MTTVEQLERDVWPDPASDASCLVRRCAHLRRKPVSDFTVEDLRVLLGQEIGVHTLLPRAIRILLEDPLVAGDYYPGDLLAVVLRLPDPVWDELRMERRQLMSVVAGLTDDGLVPADPRLAGKDELHSLLTRFRT